MSAVPRPERDRNGPRASPLAGITVLLVVLLAQAGPSWAADTFDWRNVNGQNYLTPVKDQGSVNTCWAFAAIGALEAKLEITANAPNWNPDLSEQHLVMAPNGGNAEPGNPMPGGWEFTSIKFFKDSGVVSEAEMPYRGDQPVPDWPLAPGWEDRVYKITDYSAWITATTANIKANLKAHGPLAAAINSKTDWHWPSSSAVTPEAGAALGSGPVGAMDELGEIDHAVVIVGYQDFDASDGYYIVKNSWGNNWGDSGYGYVLYDTLESHRRVHAITGDAYYVPEPAGISLPAIGGVILIRRRKRA